MNFDKTPHLQPGADAHLADQAADAADKGLRSVRHEANQAFDGLASTVESLRHEASPQFERLKREVHGLSQRGRDALFDSTQQLRDQADRATAGTRRYVRQEPVKSLLVAAATGAAVLAIAQWLGRSSRRG